MKALRQTTRLLRHRPLQQVRAAHEDSTATDTVHKVDGEIGIASGAPENIYKRQVRTDLALKGCLCRCRQPGHDR